jgi:tripartite ATP-independent transporter DctM subunit
MSDLAIGFVSLAAILVLIAIRVPIGIALSTVAFVGTTAIAGSATTFSLAGLLPYDFAASWELSAIPMFLLMGTLTFHTGLVTSLYDAARLWLRALPGGLAVATNLACAGFAAASGSSVATTVAMGRIAVPEMLRAGYDKGLSTAVAACAGTLGSLIPPSVLMILYCAFTGQSVAKMFLAGVLPGLLTAAIYAGMIIGRCYFKPSLAPRLEGHANWAERIAVLRSTWPLPLLILGVIGGLYGGLVTPTEAGAFGAGLAFLIALAQGKLTWAAVKISVIEALEGTATIFFAALGAILLTRLMAFSGVPDVLSELAKEWATEPWMLVLGCSIVYFILGCFLEPIGLVLLTLPVMIPAFEAKGVDMIWFGIMVVKYVEIGLMTPPVGLNVYAVKTIVGDAVSLNSIFAGTAWFLVCEALILVLLFLFPEITLVLPNMMSK